ncbi:MAG: adenosylcobalamin-dependent ribonucleoside-diphosphate reductase, partial [Draconibacterium sp.]|nr:adenosylcobalamin-dependent ribonucleoside-diphosphate reductase [Draconibacterium sp.]
ISIKHPDSEAFIDAKMEKGKVTGANVSVRIDDAFMKAVKNDTLYIQHYPVDWEHFMQDSAAIGFLEDFANGEIEENKLYTLGKGFYAKAVKARKIWEKIIHNAWKSAEPGILFWDNIINESVADCYADKGFRTTSTNPCGEIPLCPNDSCRLLALNLYGYVVNPFTMDAYFDEELFARDVQIAMRYMDDIIDLELEKIDAIIAKIKSDPEDEFIKMYEINLWENIKAKTLEGRRTGLGITGLGDMLAALGLTYGTDDANTFIESVQRGLKLNAYQSSVNMAKERGAFEVWDADKEKNNPFILRIQEEDFDLWDEMMKYGRRNISLLTIAPTGTVSLMTQTTSGCEPVFLPVYKRRRKINPNDKDARVDFVDETGISWMEYNVFHHNFETWLKVNNHDIDVIKGMSDEELAEIVKQSPYYKATSNDVDWVKKVEMQGMIQKHVDHSISVTVNLPNDVSEETVAAVYSKGHESGCKGITVYRDGSRSGVLITDEEKASKNRMDIFKDNHAPKRPKRLKGDIHRFQNNLEKWIAVVGINNGRPYEIFTGRLQNGLTELPNSLHECEVVKKITEEEDGSRGKRYDIEYIDSHGERIILEGLSHTFNPEFWNYSKMISGVLRHGMPMAFVYDLVNSLNLEGDHLNTWKNGVTRIIKKYVKDGEKAKGKCPDCHSTNLEFKEGCLTCMNCGNSKCG